jgi:glycosyltransferase involved in cell wall biosynthesis
VAAVVASPDEAVFHYLEFGLAEQRDGKPEGWSPSFLRTYHGIALAEELSAKQANAMLRRAGIGAAEALLEERHLWAINGLCGGVFSRIFEHEFYAVAAEAAGIPLSAADRLSAIAHYCTTGLPRGVPPHPDHLLDPDFYRAALDLAGLDPPTTPDAAALLRHWAGTGLRAGAHANPRAWFRNRTGVDLPQAVLTALPAFRAHSADLGKDASLPETLAHLADVPVPGAAALDLAAPGVEGFLIDLARFRRQAGDPGAAEWLLARVIDRVPDHPRASLDLADLIHGQGRIATEIQLRRVVPADFDTGANGITLAERLVAQNRLKDALDVCDTLPETVFGDVVLHRRRRALGGAIFNSVWNDLGARLATTPVSEVQVILSRALRLYTPPFTPPARSAPIRRVAIVANDDLYQCKLYRADQKIDQLRAAGYEADLFVQHVDLDRLRDRLDRYDAVIFARVPAFLEIIDLIVEATQQGLATFYDCDDLIFDPEQFPPPLSTYAGRLSATDHAAIACGVPLFRHAMALCTYGIASTPTIREAMAPVVGGGQVFLHRNALGALHMRAMEQAAQRRAGTGDKVVIYYGSGTKAHKTEFSEILEPALAEVLAARPGRVEIRLIGEFPALGHLDPDHPDLRLVDPVWDFEAFCAEVAQADINLSVLDPTPLTDAKSEIKWMEAAMFAIPSIVSPTATYRDVIEDGVTGLLASDRAGFVRAMLRLIDHADLRHRIGHAAQETVLRDYGLPAMGAMFDAMFSSVRPDLPAPKARLLIVNVFYPPQDIGGATRVVQDNVRDLVDLYGDCYEIDVITTLEGGEHPHTVTCYARDGVRIWTVTARDGVDSMAFRDHRMADVFDRLLSRIRPDIVHLHCIQRLTASIVDTLRRRGLPYVVTVHDGWWVSPNQFILSPDARLETYDFTRAATGDSSERARVTQRSLAGAAAVLAVSEAFADLHRKAGVARIDTVENGVSALPDLVRRPGPEGRVRLGHIGGASRHKGYELLRAAIHARRFDNLDLVVLDHALPPGRTRQEVWNGTPVRFLPRHAQTEVGRLYGQIDVLLAPSVWPESYGLVTREALALGLWVVASDRGAIGQDVVEGENGFVVDVADHRALVACLAQIDADPDRFAKPPARRSVLRPAAAQAQDLHRVYQRILAADKPSKQEI